MAVLISPVRGTITKLSLPFDGSNEYSSWPYELFGSSASVAVMVLTSVPKFWNAASW